MGVIQTRHPRRTNIKGFWKFRSHSLTRINKEWKGVRWKIKITCSQQLGTNIYAIILWWNSSLQSYYIHLTWQNNHWFLFCQLAAEVHIIKNVFQKWQIHFHLHRIIWEFTGSIYLMFRHVRVRYFLTITNMDPSGLHGQVMQSISFILS